MNREIESQSSPNIIPDWYKEHKERTQISKVERTEEEKAAFCEEVDRMLEDYLRWRDA